jgi:methionine sulfoxide reductase catalytic subunit
MSKNIPSSFITPREIFEDRRQFLKIAAISAIGMAEPDFFMRQAFASSGSYAGTLNQKYSTDEKLTAKRDILNYNNFYEFTTDKAGVSGMVSGFNTDNWKLLVDGMVHKPKVFDMADLLKIAPMEERIYRLRCVEGWSMVIPWEGYSLSNLIKLVEPNSSAKYIAFTSVEDKKAMPGLASEFLDWPYHEGLRIDEAMHPLTLLTFGAYGDALSKQNGAPVRLITPWKYGFKSAKSIVRITFTDKQPSSSWNAVAPKEYGFYSNVNPNVDHPRWSQASERRIGAGSFSPKIKTQMFNGYPEVASLYSGMDLAKYF